MSYNDNLPPGCRESDIPGNRPEDFRAERIIEESDNFDTWWDWITRAKWQEFDEYCFEHFWEALKEAFLGLLHPAALKALDPEDPIGHNEAAWEDFLRHGLKQDKREVLVKAFVDSNRDDFEQWVLDKSE